MPPSVRSRVSLAVLAALLFTACPSSRSEPSGSSDPLALRECVEVGEGSTLLTTWDASLRVRSQHATAAPESAVTLAWRYDEAGRLVAYAVFGSGQYATNFQGDTRYDPEGNCSDDRGSSPDAPDLQVPSSAQTSIGTAYENEYDAQGQLVTSTATPYGEDAASLRPKRTRFETDARGRCQRIEVADLDTGAVERVETRSYDDADRLVHVDVQKPGQRAPAGAPPCASTTTTKEYDSKGRLVSSRVVTAQSGCPAQAQGLPVLTETYAYADDGSVRYEVLDFTTEQPNDTVRIDGQDLSVVHAIWTRSPGCASIDAQIGADQGNQCRVR